MIKHSGDETSIICDKCKLVMKFEVNIVDEIFMDGLPLYGWKVDYTVTPPRHTCYGCIEAAKVDKFVRQYKDNLNIDVELIKRNNDEMVK